MINSITLVGRLTKDPDLKYAQSGTAICNFTLAVNRNFKTQDGQDADFINCVVFKGGAESLANYQRKGNLIGVTGRIQTRNYENSEGKRVYVTEVICDSVQFLEPKKSNQQPEQQQSQAQQQTQQAVNKGQLEPLDITDDDLPF